ncbi:MAG: hypothetical protein JSV89_10115 [Spirochaetaceae bacterium]|nr:MAG: hypothetical protein JSV89_10115 [Spirochaetaceae bacterium]
MVSALPIPQAHTLRWLPRVPLADSPQQVQPGHPAQLGHRGGLLKFCTILALCLCTCCGPIADIRERLDPDLTPPLLLGVRTLSSEQLELLFDEPPLCRVEDIAVDPALEVISTRSEDCRLLVQIAPHTPGLPYQLEALVEDAAGNGLHFLAVFYGFNGNLPTLLINEFTTRGSGNHPDAVEIKVMERGNMGGVVLYEGTPSNHDDRLIFPAFEVAAGEYLIVHFKPEGITGEIDETTSKDLSGGLDASDQAYDFWIPEGTGISGNNGVISLYARPGGEILDGVLYSDRTSDSDEKYGGFGTLDSLERAQELVADSGWLILGEQVYPEDAVSPEGSTGTRSICRSPDSADTDTAADWHIVPTLGLTFGEENSDEVYVP